MPFLYQPPENMPIKQRRLFSSLMTHYRIRLLPLRRRKVLRGRPLRTPPIALADEKRTPYGPRIDLSAVLLHQILLRLDDAAGFAFVIDANDFAADLERLAGGGWGERF
jgi:hypothetical protein